MTTLTSFDYLYSLFLEHKLDSYEISEDWHEQYVKLWIETVDDKYFADISRDDFEKLDKYIRQRN